VLTNTYGISIMSWSLPTDHFGSRRLLLQLKRWPFRLVFSLSELGKAGKSYSIPSLQVKSFSVTLTAVPSLEPLSPLPPFPARISPSTQLPAYPMQPPPSRERSYHQDLQCSHDAVWHGGVVPTHPGRETEVAHLDGLLVEALRVKNRSA
jgi:hypothetical protein